MQTLTINEKSYRLKQTKVTRREEEFGHSYWLEEHGWTIGVTTLLDMAIPKDAGLINYFKQTDAVEQEIRLNETGEQGTRVHQAAEQLLMGETVPATSLYTTKEKKCIAAFIEWFRIYQPQETMSEQVIAYIDKSRRFAGTLDIVCKINGIWCVIDLKTGRRSQKSHDLQVASYAGAVEQSYGIKVEKKFCLYLGTQHKTQGRTKNSLGLQKSGPGWNLEESFYTFDDFLRVYDFAMFLNGGYPEPPTIQVFPEVFQLVEEVQPKK